MKKNYGITFVQDYPMKGVKFLDINGLLNSPKEYRTVIDAFCGTIKANTSKREKYAIISTESRGFLFGAPVAYKLNKPLILIRKKGKIPNNPYKFHITNEYDSYDMEMDGDLLEKYNTFVYIDDILATGNTLGAVRQAVESKGKKVLLAAHLTSVEGLKEVREKNELLKNLRMFDIINVR